MDGVVLRVVFCVLQSDNTLLENEVTESMEILDGEGEQGMTDMSRDLEEGVVFLFPHLHS